MKDAGTFISVYTRTVNQEEYPAGLANSIHFSYGLDGSGFEPLNRNYGILFAEGDITSENTISPKGVKDPKIFHMNNGLIGICGVRIYENGEPDESCLGKVLVWVTKDLIHFEEKGLVDYSELLKWKPSDVLEVDKDIAERAIVYWSPIVNTKILVPECIEVRNQEELDAVKVKAVYNDGSEVYKSVCWQKDKINFTKPDIYDVEGCVIHSKFMFPLAKGYGDPVILKWEGKWYFIATNDNLNDIGLYVREATDIKGLFEDNVTEHLILPFDKERGFEQTFWAPEFHLIGGELYILFAVSGAMWGPQCHVMKLKKGRSIIEADSWGNPIRVQRADGTPLAVGAITLDMTYIKTEKDAYMVWSYREHIGTSRDSGSMLYIAAVDEKEPWKLTSEPVLLSRPLYGWENVEGTINNEGPYAFIKNGKVYLTYSGGSANAYTYALGLLTADISQDLLDVNVWNKSITPVLTFYSVKGEYGPGHNSFFEDEYGQLMIAYHGETDIKEHLRCDGIRRVHFRQDGTPYFEMSFREDLKEEFQKVKVKVIVK